MCGQIDLAVVAPDDINRNSKEGICSKQGSQSEPRQELTSGTGGPCQNIRLSSISNNQGLINTKLPDSIVDSQKYPLLAIIFALWCQTLVNDHHLKLNCLFSGSSINSKCFF